MNQYLQENQDEFNNAIDFFKSEIATIRTGRANPAVLDGVSVKAYGVFSPLNTLSTITVSDSRNIIVTPFDKSTIKDVEKGIMDANLGLGVLNDGDKIRLTIPLLTEETRLELVKSLNEKMEKTRIQLRQARETVKDLVELAFDDKEITEDDKFRFIKELDEHTAKRNEELKNIRDKKETYKMAV